ncbi:MULTISPECIES: ATP-binding protein [unclassified Actinotalea]|uniref:sensor histidine kinase n=1 Tax=unclassified Actinotalea TaxID=2638618 RepID=UPI0015F688B3|nr:MULTISPECIES: ATP-binding protein [unclassified Actinotalea]
MSSRVRPGSATSLTRRLAVASTAVGVALALLTGAALWALVAFTERLEAVTGLYFDAVTEADSAYTMFVDAETAVRGYALTGDPVTLEPYSRLTAGVADFLTGTATEQALVEDLGVDHAVLDLRADVASALRAWSDDFADPTIAAVEADGPAAVAPGDIERGRLLFEDVRTPMEEYLDAVKLERAAAVDELNAWNRVLRAVLLVFALGAVAVGALLWVYLRRWVTTPLAQLAQDARVVADGDVAHPVAVTGPGEVGQVGRDVEQMRLRLVDLLAEAHASRAALEESHAQLVEQAEDLRRSNRDLEQFAYVASHDLQEPLRKVASFTQLLAKRYEGQLDERADQYIAFAVDGAKRMQRLINDLLGFSRVGRIGGELSDVDLDAVVRRVVGDLDEQIAESGGEVLTQDLPVVRGEEPLLTQLVANLVGNALKFRHPERAPRVRLEGRRAGDVWELACHDNGIGIDPQYADRVFVIFQRLHAKDVYEGTGIGLALCKKIVEYHGGQIWIDPEPADGGTTIRWTLPVRGADGVEPDGAQADGADRADPVGSARAAEVDVAHEDAGTGGEDAAR